MGTSTSKECVTTSWYGRKRPKSHHNVYPLYLLMFRGLAATQMSPEKLYQCNSNAHLHWQLRRRRPSVAAHIEWQAAGRRGRNVAPLRASWGQDARNGAHARGINTRCFSTVGPQTATGSRIPASVTANAENNSVEQNTSLKSTRNSPPFMKCKGSLQCSQQIIACSFPESDKPTPTLY
jgi:hypothetical protein